MNKPTSWTKEAITKIYATVSMNGMPAGTKTKLYRGQQIRVASTITKTTAKPIPNDELTFLETPKNGQIP